MQHYYTYKINTKDLNPRKKILSAFNYMALNKFRLPVGKGKLENYAEISIKCKKIHYKAY